MCLLHITPLSAGSFYPRLKDIIACELQADRQASRSSFPFVEPSQLSKLRIILTRKIDTRFRFSGEASASEHDLRLSQNLNCALDPMQPSSLGKSTKHQQDNKTTSQGNKDETAFTCNHESIIHPGKTLRLYPSIRIIISRRICSSMQLPKRAKLVTPHLSNICLKCHV